MNVSVDFLRTQATQREASDPAASAWVVANAGSGKTHVLTQRVIRLLLSGTDPAGILCLTFTKVAAAEMARRIFGVLGRWATLPEAELRGAVAELQGRAPSAPELRQARRLFASALETPGGLKIQTVHAFCERLLHQFPFEANVPGQFAILDDTAAAALIAGARAEAMAAAAAAPQCRLGAAMRYLAEHAGDADIAKALDCLIAERETLRRWMDRAAGEGGAGSVDDTLADLRARLGLASGETAGAICREICQTAHWDREQCAALAEALSEAIATAESNSYDRAAHAALRQLAAAGDFEEEAEHRLGFFLVEDKAGWKSRSASHRFSAAFGRSQAGLAERFADEAERLVGLTLKLRSARSFEATEALLVVGDAILQAYHRAKKQAGFLDFGDLIVKARNLLARSDAAAWVLYKLDQRIDHILVDEAQDTSPDQWAVVQALADDFFAGESARGPRTIFAVGDDKQSIFGFQGAAPHMLAAMQRFFARRNRAAGAAFVERPLFLSFRSTREILDAVDRVFSGGLEGKVTDSDYVAHAAQRQDEPGQVLVLPRIVRKSAAQPEDWTTPFDAPAAAEVALAEQIAREIGRLIGTALPSGKVVQAREILILTRKRGAFVVAMSRALRSHGIPAAGADRIPVATHIAVMDLLALADVMLLPEDDLQLAACLKSPLIGLSEDELMALAMERDRRSLWSALAERSEPGLRAAAARLQGWRGMADQMTPFRFFATVLGPDGGRRGFRARLGGEADDVLDAFLMQALAYEAVEPPSLQGFLRYLRASRGDIKREAEEAGAGVRIMTVHGAKGLEADVVFLADTGSPIIHGSHRPVLVDIGGASDPALLWRRAAKDATDLQAQADARGDEETRKEYLRLLYVAMTRARDMLVICGIRSEKAEVEGCWYSLVQRALVPEDAPREAETGELAQPYAWPQPPRPAAVRPMAGPPPEGAAEEAPDWLTRPAPSPPPAPQPLRPSRALGEPDGVRGPETARSVGALLGGEAALRRGRLVHSLLQLAGGAPAEARGPLIDRLLAREAPGDPDYAAALRDEVAAVLAEPELAPFFGPQSRAEVPIVGQVATAAGAYAVSGQIDRLLRDTEGWRLLDFKTDRAVPESLDAVDPAYILQLALYARLVAEMEPGTPVRAGIAWTAGPKIMPIPPDLLAQSLVRLGIGETRFA